MNIGAGRVVDESLVLINKKINDGSFFMNKELLAAIDNVKKNNSNLHLFGLLQDQGVHSHQDHLFALLKLAEKKGVIDKVFVHIFTDGRDSPPKSAKKFISELKKNLGSAAIGSVIGRYYAMDRDRRWERTKIAYDALVNAEGVKVNDVDEAISNAYAAGESDEFIKPRIIKGFKGIKNKDSVVFYNYRLDRARQITHAFINDDFSDFKRKKLKNIVYVCFEEYYKGVDSCKDNNCLISFKREDIKNNLGQVLADNNLKQLRTAETEKYAHVTFFFNSQVEEPNKNEERVLIHSPKVATYDLQPEMSAVEVKNVVVKAIKASKYDVIIVNFANADMVGHTGVFDATVKAIETIDKCVGEIVNNVLIKKGVCLISADHGNAEEMFEHEDKNDVVTSHTTNDVPFILIGKDFELRKDKECKLADIAPTMLDVLGIKQPKEMTGKSLIK